MKINNNVVTVKIEEEKEYYYRKNRKSAKMYKAHNALLKVYNVNDTQFNFQYEQDNLGTYFYVQLQGKNITKEFIKGLNLGLQFDKLFMAKDDLITLRQYVKNCK